MSGGYFDYTNYPDDIMGRGGWRDHEIDQLAQDLFGHEDGKPDEFGARGHGGLASCLDFWLSCDYSEEAYRDAVARFKAKWFRRTPRNRVEFYESLMREHAEKLIREFEGEVVGDE